MSIIIFKNGFQNIKKNKLIEVYIVSFPLDKCLMKTAEVFWQHVVEQKTFFRKVLKQTPDSKICLFEKQSGMTKMFLYLSLL